MVSFLKYLTSFIALVLSVELPAQDVPWTRPLPSLNTVPLVINCIPQVDGQQLADGDYIGVFNNQGRCFGLARWRDTINFNVTVYGFDGTTDGFVNGDILSLRVWLRGEDCVLEKISEVTADEPLVFANSVANRINILNFERLAVSYPAESYCLNETTITPELNYPVDDLSFSSAQGLAIDQSTGTINPPQSIPGAYSVALNTAFCLSRKEFSLIMHDFPRLSAIRDTFLCGDKALQISLSGNFSSIQWNNGETSRDVELVEPASVWYRVVNDKGCSNSDTFSVKQTAIKRLDYTIDNADCYKKGAVRINNSEIENGRAPFIYRLTRQLAEKDSFEAGDAPEGVYHLEVVNTNGCVLQHKQNIVIEKDCLNDKPVFSPNYDGLDDRYFINLEGRVKIFDRNGTLKRRLTAPCYFDGNDETGSPLPMGTYLVVPEKGKNITLTILR